MLAGAAAGMLLAILSEPARSDETLGYLAVYQDEAAGSCEFTPSGPGYAYVVLNHSLPAQQLTFTAPRPSFIGGILFETSAFATTGDSQTGITVDLGLCMSPPVTVLSIYHLGAGSIEGCATWPVGEEFAYEYEFVDCNGETRQGRSAVYAGPTIEGFCCPGDLVLTPYDPYPPDGATGVPTNVILSWTLPDQVGGEWVYFTDEPYPPGIWCSIRDDYFTTWEPEGLQPNTTYYWMVGLEWNSCYSGVRSDFWSFTTGEGPVATRPATWGRVKALYGD